MDAAKLQRLAERVFSGRETVHKQDIMPIVSSGDFGIDIENAVYQLPEQEYDRQTFEGRVTELVQRQEEREAVGTAPVYKP